MAEVLFGEGTGDSLLVAGGYGELLLSLGFLLFLLRVLLRGYGGLLVVLRFLLRSDGGLRLILGLRPLLERLRGVRVGFDARCLRGLLQPFRFLGVVLLVDRKRVTSHEQG